MSDTCNTSKDELDLLEDDVEADFSGSQADVEGAAENIFSSPPCPQPLCFESLSLRTPQTVQSAPGTALQHKIESKLEKSLGAQFNIQVQQQMGVFQPYKLEAMKSLGEEMQSIKKASEAEVDQASAPTSKAGLSKQSVELSNPNNQPSLGLPISRMANNLWKHTFVVPLFHSLAKVSSPNMAPNHQIFIPNTEQPERVCSSRA